MSKEAKINHRIGVKERILVKGTWVADTALHTSGEEDDPESSADMVLLRNSDGQFFISGASIAGAGRNYVARRLLDRTGYAMSSETNPMRALFGHVSARRDFAEIVAEYASLLNVLDAKLDPEGQKPKVFQRDAVRIDPPTGIAADQAKFGFQVLPKDTRFIFSMWVTLYETLPLGVGEADVLAVLRTMLDGFATGEIRLGARTRRGFGAGKLSGISIYRLRMSDRKELAAWLSGDLKDIKPKGADVVGDPLEDKRNWFQIDAGLRLRTSLLVRSPGESVQGPDTTHLSENGKCIMPGTSLAGALRARCHRIATTLCVTGPTSSDCKAKKAFITEIFGEIAPPPVTGRLRNDRKENQLQAGRISVTEELLNDKAGARHVQGRVAIDRFTGGAKDSALFDAAPFWPDGPQPQLNLHIHLNDPEDKEMGLLLLAFKDLWLGDLPLGGEVGGGRGVFHGVWADIKLRKDGAESIIMLKARNGDPNVVEITPAHGAKTLDHWVRELGKGAANV